MSKIKSPFMDDGFNHDLEEGIKRLQDIEDGNVLPTFVEFFKLCILY